MSVTVSFAAVGVQNDQPDIIIEQGEPLEMKCLATSLSRLIKSRLDQTWIHNSTTFRQLKDVRAQNTETLKISSSNFSDSGIWNCRYAESSSSREWTTNVIKVLVVPPRSLLQKILPVVIAITICLIIIAVVGKVYLNRLKKKKLNLEDDNKEDKYKYGYGYGYGEQYDDEDYDEPTPLFADKLKGFNSK